jgi:sugar O-acyltransferase (sialic acid O-acetyltransferase NeuD family)
MLLYGGSGHAKVIIDCLSSQHIPVQGIFDDNPNLKELLHISVWGKYQPSLSSHEKLIISIGNNEIRCKVAGFIQHAFGTAIHTSAILSPYAAPIGEGTVIFHRTVIQASAIIGKHCIINTSASVDHDCVLDDFVHISPNATLCGGVKVGEGTHIGTSASVIPLVKIGKWCVVGAGAVVTKDLPDYSVAVGVPARVIKMKQQL